MKIAVLLSGGVDSSVSALLLKEKGYNLVGVHLHCFDFCNPQDAEDARRVAEILNIPFYVFDLTDEFEEKVINYMIRTYEKGLTPNPDVYCNQFIKFGVFFDKALNLGYEMVASGHYARTQIDANLTRTDANNKKDNLNIESNKRNNSSGNYLGNISGGHQGNTSEIHLLKAKDQDKDQTYFLWSIEKEKFSKIIFPVGDLLKTEVREIAKKYNLPVAEKKESMGICFVGQVKLREFLSQYLKPKEGKIIDTEGRILGTHPGYFYFTEGQRHGLNIKVGDGPYYVAQKIPEENLIVVAKEGHPLLYSQKIEITEINILEKEILFPQTNTDKTKTHADYTQTYADYINNNYSSGNHPGNLSGNHPGNLSGNHPGNSIIIDVRFRHRQPLVKAKLILRESEYSLQKSAHSLRGSAFIEFLEPQKFVAPGQSIVFYKDDIVLGGGIILKRIN
ncbi:MAG: tRNA-specific 2-thiouridylase MnmA [Candidatus Parcubacteria bacterium]|nr:MAG: tRNA-specific 2-thiouridylase MnmA [Candidatus Parcubacteria bacterium]